MKDTFRLMETAIKYVEANKNTDWIMAYAGGSVGRGDADRYSDLDLNVVVSSPLEHSSINLSFEDCDIQVHIHAWNGSEEMRSAPWRNRYLSEARPVYDPHHIMAMLKPAAMEYFRSQEGRCRMVRQAHDEVQQYLQQLDSCLRSDEQMGASIAVHNAWHTAAASVVWMNCECCAGGALLGHIRDMQPALYEAFSSIAINHAASAGAMLEALSYYRSYLRSSTGHHHFAFDPVMDRIMARRAERYMHPNGTDCLNMLLRGEALRCYGAAGGLIEQFGQRYNEYPAAVQEALGMLGCLSYTSGHISELLSQIEQLSESAMKAARGSR